MQEHWSAMAYAETKLGLMIATDAAEGRSRLREEPASRETPRHAK